jgi:hypothetical protein
MDTEREDNDVRRDDVDGREPNNGYCVHRDGLQTHQYSTENDSH